MSYKHHPAPHDFVEKNAGTFGRSTVEQCVLLYDILPADTSCRHPRCWTSELEYSLLRSFQELASTLLKPSVFVANKLFNCVCDWVLPIKAPLGEHERVYVNRKSFHSIMTELLIYGINFLKRSSIFACRTCNCLLLQTWILTWHLIIAFFSYIKKQKLLINHCIVTIYFHCSKGVLMASWGQTLDYPNPTMTHKHRHK